ncbi:MAG TPA: hypothetical protein PK662_09780 [Bacteroidales bacterium]|mgnify:CR=1 FL=1|nr:hypothetical protein [Bacteroidales bacterium]
MNKIHIITLLTTLNSAYANRLMAIVRGFMENGVEVEMLLLQIPHEVEANLKHAGIPFVNLSGKRGNKYMRLLVALFRLIPFLKRNNVFLMHIIMVPFFRTTK